MGALFSRLRKKKETTEVLEELDNEIKDCINFRLENQESQKRWVGRLTLWGLTLYVLFALLYYLMYFPVGWVERIVYSTILIVVPVMLILASRRGLMWYYSRKITSNEDKLLLLKEEKERILEEVMENETYKKAKEILDKYDPERFKTMTPPRSGFASNPSTPGSELRQRKGKATLSTPSVPPAPSTSALAIGPPPDVNVQSSSAPCQNSKILRPPKNTPIRALFPARPGAVRPLSNGAPNANLPNRGPPMGSSVLTRPPVLPRPVLQSDRGVLDRMVEYLVGDGPSNRYALVCRRCHRHNGMALKEEFEFLAFHCAYCQFLNPSKRKRPSAPRLPESNPASGRDSDAGSESDFNLGVSSSTDALKLTSSPSSTSVDEKVETSEDARSSEKPAVTASAHIEPTVEEEDGEEDARSNETRRESIPEEEEEREGSAESVPETNVARSTSLAGSNVVEDADADSGAEVGITEVARDESTDAMEAMDVETLS